ncbi:hypothetical protein [Microcoleus sp. bin38.metabat.b11b12b14.051]|uniref:hypothetical protein n=1 Tax=Microcoleus sp. bin38.metabat.b11b12b14.051 TaxID=2742709 RepID=UPI0025F9464B|nr:hypothetical protein [Microcoleus sp. bin38.metabat.b11b12b14.051]
MTEEYVSKRSRVQRQQCDGRRSAFVPLHSHPYFAAKENIFFLNPASNSVFSQ